MSAQGACYDLSIGCCTLLIHTVVTAVSWESTSLLSDKQQSSTESQTVATLSVTPGAAAGEAPCLPKKAGVGECCCLAAVAGGAPRPLVVVGEVVLLHLPLGVLGAGLLLQRVGVGEACHQGQGDNSLVAAAGACRTRLAPWVVGGGGLQ
jgi:hypothetical protein